MDLNLEINNVVRLSSCHVSADSTAWLDKLCESYDACRALIGYKSQNSYILYCMSFEILSSERDCVPPNVLNLIAFANALGCDVIWLDPLYKVLSYLCTYSEVTMTTLDRPDRYTMLTLSTGHISETSRALLNTGRLSEALDGSVSLSSLLSKDEYGWFIFGVRNMLCRNVSADLRSVISYADRQGCDAICFDCDGNYIEELKWFDD